MKLIISGAPKGRGVDQNLLRRAANFYTSILMQQDTHCLATIKVELRIVPNLVTDYNSDAFCHWQDRAINPTEFLLELDQDANYKRALIAAAHEFTHIKQLAFGEKQQSLDGMRVRWMGQLMDPNELNYYDLPWEIEALGREYGLYERFDAVDKNLNCLPGQPLE